MKFEERKEQYHSTYIHSNDAWLLIIDFLVPLMAEAQTPLGFIISIAFQSAFHPVAEQMSMNLCKMNEWMDGFTQQEEEKLWMCKKLQGAQKNWQTAVDQGEEVFVMEGTD